MVARCFADRVPPSGMRTRSSEPDDKHSKLDTARQRRLCWTDDVPLERARVHASVIGRSMR
jgi:hypothetical protein